MDNEITLAIYIGCLYIIVALFIALLYSIEHMSKKINRRELILTSLLWFPILIFEVLRVIKSWVK